MASNSDPEAVSRRVQVAVEKLVEDVDRSGLRKMQGDMHRCCASCCDQSDLTTQGVLQCQKKCSRDMQQANEYMGRQMSNLQSRLERCALECQDKVKDKMSASGIKEPTANDMDQYRGVYEECVHKCVDTHIHLMQGLAKKLQDAIKNKSYQVDSI